MAEFLDITRAESVVTVMLSRPELHNAFNDAMIEEIRQTFADLGADESVRVIILAGAGKSFCAGADLNWMQSMLHYTFEENVADANRLAQMLKTINNCPKPVIGRVHGAVFGGGVGLVSTCDMVVSVAKAKYCLSEVKLGILPAVISPFVLQKMPPAAARRYFLTAERFDAEEARHVGLVHVVVEDEAGLDAQIAAWVESLLANAPQAVGLCKSLIRDIAAMPTDKAMAEACQRIAERRISEEGQDGMTAFLEKRSPAWVSAVGSSS